MDVKNGKRGKRRQNRSRPADLIALRALIEKGMTRLEIQAALGIGPRSFYYLRARLRELGEFNQEIDDG